jgi:hypothetical protein
MRSSGFLFCELFVARVTRSGYCNRLANANPLKNRYAKALGMSRPVREFTKFQEFFKAIFTKIQRNSLLTNYITFGGCGALSGIARKKGNNE